MNKKKSKKRIKKINKKVSQKKKSKKVKNNKKCTEKFQNLLSKYKRTKVKIRLTTRNDRLLPTKFSMYSRNIHAKIGRNPNTRI